MKRKEFRRELKEIKNNNLISNIEKLKKINKVTNEFFKNSNVTWFITGGNNPDGIILLK